MRGADGILEQLKKLPYPGSLLVELPNQVAAKYRCLHCSKKTFLIMNYGVQNYEIGHIVFKCIRTNIKNVPLFRYPISVCGEKCLLAEIALVYNCILEEITR